MRATSFGVNPDVMRESDQTQCPARRGSSSSRGLSTTMPAGRATKSEDGREEGREGRATSSGKRGKTGSARRTTHVSLLTSIIVCCALMMTALKRHTRGSTPRFPVTELRTERLLSFPSKLAATVNVMPSTFSISGRTKTVQPDMHRRKLDLNGVPEALTTIRQDWKVVLNNFLDDTEHVEMFSARKIREHFHADINNVQNTCMLVTIKNGNVTFQEKYRPNQHSRASSAKYVLRKIVKEKGASVGDSTFMVMMSDGHRPLVPTFGSARHWKSWKMLTPVPLGNSRGTKAEWGTPFEGWNSYIDNTIVSKHVNYSWGEKFEKALFRGSLSMQKYKLGSCNEENRGRCERAQKWSEINRGVLYTRAQENADLFDIAFTQHKKKEDGPANCFDGAPPVGLSMSFANFQRYKYIINVGNNQDWAERLRSLLYMNSIVIVHQAETQEFFTPLMKPWMHFIPTNLLMDDLVSNVQWARENDEHAQQIVRNQNAFADRYITERSMQQYWEVALEEFGARQRKADGDRNGDE